jgi:hypothetical protein
MKKDNMGIKDSKIALLNYFNHGYEPQGKPWTQIPPQSSGVLYPPLSAGLFD